MQTESGTSDKEPSVHSSSASTNSLISRHVHRLQGQLDRLQQYVLGALQAHRRSLDDVEVRLANAQQAIVAGILTVVALLQLLRILS